MEISLNVISEPVVEGPTLKVTPKAAEEARRLLTTQAPEGAVVRVGVRGGGCSGLTYTMDFDTKTSEYDEVIEVEGVKFAVDTKSAIFLKGTTLDYVNALMGGGFKFLNPNSTGSCGCGESFSA